MVEAGFPPSPETDIWGAPLKAECGNPSLCSKKQTYGNCSLQRGYKLKIEIVSRGLETLLDDNSVVALERGCGMCWAISSLGVEVREAPKFSLGVRSGLPELSRALVSMLTVILDLYILPCQRFSEVGGSTLPMLLQLSAQG